MSCNRDMSPEPPKRRVRHSTALLKAVPSLKNFADALDRDTSYRIPVGRLQQNSVQAQICFAEVQAFKWL